MSWRGCASEADLGAALRDGTWPQACEPALRAHVASCRACRELVLVSGALTDAARQSTHVAAMRPRAAAPGALWWRAQLRRRYDATQRAARPVAWAETIGLAALLAALAGVVVWRAHSLLAWSEQARAAWIASPLLLPVIAGAGALLIAAATVYWLTGRE